MAKLGSLFFLLSLSLLNYHFFTCLAKSRKNITTDESSLLAFKSSITLDPNNPMVHNWSTPSSLCTWVGVTCDERHGRVHALNLSNMGLKGTISPQLGNLSFLVYLNLQGNGFTGELPQSLFRLHRLKFLDLSHNSFQGNLPSNICKGLPNLRKLYLSYNKFSGEMPTLWHECENMEDLALSFNGFNKGPMPEDMKNLNKLQYLDLSSNNLEGGISFSLFNITTLEMVYLGGNNLNGNLQSELCHPLSQLKSFVLTGNQFEGTIPKSIRNCTSLKFLRLDYNLFTGSIPEEIGYLDRLETLLLTNNSLSGQIASKLFNISSLRNMYLGNNFLSGTLPSDMGRGLPNLESLQMLGNKFAGNIPHGLANASKLTEIDFRTNGFSGVIPNVFGGLKLLECLHLDANNNLKLDDSFGFNFLNSLTDCRQLKYLSVSDTRLSKLPKSIGNLTVEDFWADSSGIGGNIPLEIGNMSNLIRLSLMKNDLKGPIPHTVKQLRNLQSLQLDYNGLRGSIGDELCEIRGLSTLYLSNNKLSGVLPTCLGNMTSLRYIDIASNSLISKIPSSFWSLADLIVVNLSSNAFSGNISPQIGKWRAIILLDLSGNQISSNIPENIGLITLQTLSLANNKLYGTIPTSLGEMVSLSFLDLSRNLLTGAIPKSLESLSLLKSINFSYNMLQGEIPDGGPFKNFTAQSFMHNEALCGNPLLGVPSCDKHVRRRSIAKMLLLKCMLPITVSAILVAGCIILVVHKRKKVENRIEKDLSTIGAQRRFSYYELVQATDGFSESNLLGKGSFGSVYQGMLSSGEIVAVKVIDLNFEATSKSFDVECNAMRNLRHRNLVDIISSCSNANFKSLVMKFMSNGSVEKWLYSYNYCLDFLQRLNIMIDVASALEYLHHGSSIPVVHCDLKPSNVLLDRHMVAHVSDFGIAKLLDNDESKIHTETLATLGYVAPEFGSKGVVSVKGDVYSFGIMLMEMFTRKRPTDEMFAAELTLKTWISASMPNSVMEVVDSNLVQQHEKTIQDIVFHISSIFALSLSCCAELPEERNNMTDITASLIKIKTLFLQEKEMKM